MRPAGSPERILAIGLLLEAAAAGFVVRGYKAALDVPSPPLSRVPPAHGAPPPARASRAVVVVVDGLSASAATDLPGFASLADRGARGVARAAYPTLSRPGYATLLTGAPPEATPVAQTTAGEPLELLSLSSARRGAELSVNGLVRNPGAGARLEGITAVVLLFDERGGFLTSASAPLASPVLTPGASSPFQLTLPAPEGTSRYRISASPIREALAQLAASGFVVHHGQKGFRVPPVTVENLIDITESRKVAESEALRLAIRHADANWEDEIVASYHLFERQVHRFYDGEDRRLDVYEEKHHRLRGRSTGKIYRLGDSIRVRLVEIDEVRRRLNFRLAEEPARGARTPVAPLREVGRTQAPSGRRRTRRSPR